MVQINIDGGPHGSMTQSPGTPDETRFLPYTDGRELKLLRGAYDIIDKHIFRKNVACNRYFKTLHSPGPARTFDEVWADNDIWISFEDRVGLGWDGATNAVDGKEITLGKDAYKTGNVWYVAGVLVHELAHTNGAGGPPSKAASTALKFCGLSALYDGAVGRFDQAAGDTDTRVA